MKRNRTKAPHVSGGIMEDFVSFFENKILVVNKMSDHSGPQAIIQEIGHTASMTHQTLGASHHDIVKELTDGTKEVLMAACDTAQNTNKNITDAHQDLLRAGCAETTELSHQIDRGVISTKEALERNGIANRLATERTGAANLVAVERNGGDTRAAVERTGASGLSSTERNGGDTRTAIERNGGDTRAAVERNSGETRDTVIRSAAEARGYSAEALGQMLLGNKEIQIESCKEGSQLRQELAAAFGLHDRQAADGFASVNLEMCKSEKQLHDLINQTRIDACKNAGQLSREIERSQNSVEKEVIHAKCDLERQAADNSSLARLQLSEAKGSIELDACKNKDALASKMDCHYSDLKFQAAENKHSIEIEAMRNKDALARQLAECCCELKERIDCKTGRTDELINRLETDKLREQLATARTESVIEKLACRFEQSKHGGHH